MPFLNLKLHFSRIRAQVLLGGINFRQPQQTQIVDRSGLRTHPRYDRGSKVNDIALIRLRTPAQLNGRVQLVRLAINDDSSYINAVTTASGFGKTGDNSRSDDLMYVNVRVILNSDCVRSFRPDGVDRTRLCTESGTPGNPTQACKGDSGGPLVLSSNKVQIALTSYGGKSCERGIPVVFTRINSHKNFIERTTQMSF